MNFVFKRSLDSRKFGCPTVLNHVEKCPKNCSGAEPSAFRTVGQFRLSFRSDKDKIFDLGSVGQTNKFCPNEHPCFVKS